MQLYDPEDAPDPGDWLSLDEQTRIDLVERHHVEAGVDLPNITAHSIFHAIVENQIALGLEPVCRAMIRLAKQGLNRHDAIHAVASVLAETLHDLAGTNADDTESVSQARYNAAVERLNAQEWRRKYEDDSDA